MPGCKECWSVDCGWFHPGNFTVAGVTPALHTPLISVTWCHVFPGLEEYDETSPIQAAFVFFKHFSAENSAFVPSAWRINSFINFTFQIEVTNAISGIIVVGGMLQLSGPVLSARVGCALAAVFLSSVNIVGGFAVTARMLEMFREDTKPSRWRSPLAQGEHKGLFSFCFFDDLTSN